jgi:hypothetical protein
MKLHLPLSIALVGLSALAQTPPPPPSTTNNAIAVAAMVLSTNAQAVIRAMALTATPNVTTNPAGPFLFPTNVQPAVAYSWTASLGINVTGYWIYIGVGSLQYTNKIFAGPALNLTVSNLAFGTTYYASATAVDNLGDESGFSNEVAYTTPSLPAPPGGLLAIRAQASLSPLGPWQEMGSVPMLASATNHSVFYRLAIAYQSGK